MQSSGVLVHMEGVLFDVLVRKGRVATVVELANCHEVGEVIDVLSDTGSRQCKAKINAIESTGDEWTYLELVLEK